MIISFHIFLSYLHTWFPRSCCLHLKLKQKDIRKNMMDKA